MPVFTSAVLEAYGAETRRGTRIHVTTRRLAPVVATLRSLRRKNTGIALAMDNHNGKRTSGAFASIDRARARLRSNPSNNGAALASKSVREVAAGAVTRQEHTLRIDAVSLRE